MAERNERTEKMTVILTDDDTYTSNFSARRQCDERFNRSRETFSNRHRCENVTFG